MSNQTDKVSGDPALVSRTELLVEDLKNTILNMKQKRGKLFLTGLKNQTNYLNWELTFNPTKNKSYKRKDVVEVQFGFNTGSEHGGPHWAVVIEDNKHTNPTVVVIPLGSLDQNESQENVHNDDVYLGKIPLINDNEVYAIPGQIRTISKLRIIKPKKVHDTHYTLTDEQMNAIDARLFEMLFANSKELHKMILRQYTQEESQVAAAAED